MGADCLEIFEYGQLDFRT